MRESEALAKEFNTPELRSLWVKRWDNIGDVEFEVTEGTVIDIEEAHDTLVVTLTVEEYEVFDRMIASLFSKKRDGEIVDYITSLYIEKMTPKSRFRIKRKAKPKIKIKRKE